MDRVKVDHINAQSLLANKEEVNLLVNEREIQTFYVLAKLGYLLKSVMSTLLFQIMFHIGVMQEEEVVYVFMSEMYLRLPL